MTKPLYDIRWHNAESHLLGSFVTSDPVEALATALRMASQETVAAVRVLAGAQFIATYNRPQT